MLLIRLIKSGSNRDPKQITIQEIDFGNGRVLNFNETGNDPNVSTDYIKNTVRAVSGEVAFLEDNNDYIELDERLTVFANVGDYVEFEVSMREPGTIFNVFLGGGVTNFNQLEYTKNQNRLRLRTDFTQDGLYFQSSWTGIVLNYNQFYKIKVEKEATNTFRLYR